MARRQRLKANTATTGPSERADGSQPVPRGPELPGRKEIKRPRGSQKGARKRVRVSEGIYKDHYGLAVSTSTEM